MFPQHNVIIGSATADIATARSMALRGMVDTDAWRETFPGVQPVRAADGLRWGTTPGASRPTAIPFPAACIRPSRRRALAAPSRAAAATRSWATTCSAAPRARVPTERKKVEDWAHASLLSRRKAQVGRAVVIGTSHHPDDYLSHIRAAGDWVVCHMNLLGDGPTCTPRSPTPTTSTGTAWASRSQVRNFSGRPDASHAPGPPAYPRAGACGRA
jgi:hypothetical protein